ncbi:MAG: hypothetical protein EGR98_07660 [Prevotella sp.]|nr:hypothetical protein [Prevotella sp.]
MSKTPTFTLLEKYLVALTRKKRLVRRDTHIALYHYTPSYSRRIEFIVLTTKYFSKFFHFSNNLKYKQYKKKQINPPIRIIAMKLIAEVKNCKANNDTKVSMISNAVINHHFGVVDFKGAQKDAIIKYYILYLESP